MSGWGIAETAPEIEKIKAESADYLHGLNSCGEISWEVYDYAFDFYVGLIQKAYELGKSEAEPHWIPVEQALPELMHDVLLTVFFHERWNVAEGYRQDGEFMFWNNGRLDSVLDEENRVIAWMPSPEPYKGVTE